MKIADIISPKIAGPCMVPASGSRSWNSMPLGASRASRLVDDTLVELLWRSVPEKKTRPSKCWFSPFTIAIVFGYTTVYPCNHTPFMGKNLRTRTSSRTARQLSPLLQFPRAGRECCSHWLEWSRRSTYETQMSISSSKRSEYG